MAIMYPFVDLPNGSNWIEATKFGSKYQHFINSDGRQIHRELCAPTDVEPKKWKPGPPPQA